MVLMFCEDVKEISISGHENQSVVSDKGEKGPGDTEGGAGGETPEKLRIVPKGTLTSPLVLGGIVTAPRDVPQGRRR